MAKNSAAHWRALLLRPGRAWLFLTGAIALHVADEAVHDFLGTYNPAVRSLRERIPQLPLPTFTFRAWLSGLIAGIILLLALSPFAYRRVSWLRPVAFVLSLLMIANAALHVAGSLALGRVMAGTYSAPVLFVAAVCLLVSSIRYWRRTEPG